MIVSASINVNTQLYVYHIVLFVDNPMCIVLYNNLPATDDNMPLITLVMKSTLIDFRLQTFRFEFMFSYIVDGELPLALFCEVARMTFQSEWNSRVHVDLNAGALD